MNRRRFGVLVLATAASAAADADCLGALVPGSAGVNGRCDPISIAQAISGVVLDRAAARAVAERFLDKAGSERRAGEWIMQRLAELAARDGLGADRPLADALRELRYEDFREDRTMYLDGWLFAHTEVLACAVRTLNGPWT